MPTYDQCRAKFLEISKNASISISKDIWAVIQSFLRPEHRTFEAGCGLSTLLFDGRSSSHVALESHKPWQEAVAKLVGPHTDVRFCELVGHPVWYAWEPPQAFDFVLIDGPIGRIGRTGITRVLPRLIHAHTIICIDDTHRPGEREIGSYICGLHAFAVFDVIEERRTSTFFVPKSE